MRSNLLFSLKLTPSKYIAAGLSWLLLLACSKAPEPSREAIAPASVYRINFTEAPSSLDPLKANSAYASIILTNVYDTLYRYQFLAEPYQLTPNLATGMPNISTDGKSVRIRIKSGVRFMDSSIFADGHGREVTAADVVYSLKRHFVPSNFSDGAWLWQDYLVGIKAWQKSGASMNVELEGLRALDRYELEFRLNSPMPMLTSTLASAYAVVIPKEAIEGQGRSLAQQAIGSGPYKLAEFNATRAVLVGNNAFRPEPIDLNAEGYQPALHQAFGLDQLAGRLPPLMPRIEINFIGENNTALLALERGDLDSNGLTAQALPRLLSRDRSQLNEPWNSKLHLRKKTELGTVFISFNMMDPNLGASADPVIDAKHQALRCAISQAYDWQKRAEAIYVGSAVVFQGVIPPGVPGFETRHLGSKANLNQAKLLLEKAGLTAEQLPVLRYGSTGNTEQRRIFELFRAQMLQIGYPMEKIQWQSFASFGAFIDAVNRREVMLMDMGWQFDAPDAENALQLYYGPYAAPQVNNANYQNAAFDRLYEQARSLPIGPERVALHRQMNQMLIDQCVVISGTSRVAHRVWSKRFVAWPDIDMMGGRGLRFVAAAR